MTAPRTGARLASSRRRRGWCSAKATRRGGGRTCNDASGKERDLGAPVPIDGFANGWRVVPGCAVASFTFGPQSTANLAYVVSLLAFIGMLLVLAIPWIRRRQRATRRGGADAATAAPVRLWEPPPVVPARRYRLRVAIPVALAVGLVGGVIFAWRAGPPLALGTAVVMVVGVSTGRLLLLALYGLVLVPLLYLTDPLTNLGGANFGYAEHYMGAHWVAVAVVCVLLAALGAVAARAADPSAAGRLVWSGSRLPVAVRRALGSPGPGASSRSRWRSGRWA